MSLSSGEPKPIISIVARGPSHAHTSTHAHTHTRTHIYTHTHRQANTLTKHAHLAHTDFPYWGTAARLQLHPSKDGYVKIFCSWKWPVGHDKKLQVNSYSTQKDLAISGNISNNWQYLALSGIIRQHRCGEYDQIYQHLPPPFLSSQFVYAIVLKTNNITQRDIVGHQYLVAHKKISPYCPP